MATDATGTPTSLGIPKYNTSVDAPSGLGFNAAMDSINTLLINRSSLHAYVVPVYGATVAIDASLGNYFTIQVTNGTAFTVSTPTNPVDGEQITIECRSVGFLMGAVTFGAGYRMVGGVTGFVVPALNKARSITFIYSANQTIWSEVCRTSGDI